MSIIVPTLTMDSLKYFSSLKDHPLQRNTKERQKKAKHLGILQQDHLVVQAIRVTKDFFHNDSKQHIKADSEYKCNGHTRVHNSNRAFRDRVFHGLVKTKHKSLLCQFHCIDFLPTELEFFVSSKL